MPSLFPPGHRIFSGQRQVGHRPDGQHRLRLQDRRGVGRKESHLQQVCPGKLGRFAKLKVRQTR